jgi:ribose transport system substrate-binding protein
VPGGAYDQSLVAGCAQGETKGPKGESGVPPSSLVVSPDEAAKLQAGGYKAALLWHISGDFTNALSQGVKDQLAAYGISVATEVDAGFDAATQASQVETAMALNPDVVITLVIDPVGGAAAFRPVVTAGKKLVLVSNVPDGYVAGQDYVGTVSDDFFAMGTASADLMGKALGGAGKIGYIFHDASYYVTNQRDQDFKAVLGQCFPNIQIVAEAGITDPAKGQEVAAAMLLQHPDLTGIYVTWDQPAEGVVAALRDAGRSDVKVVTLDLGANNDLEMAKGGLVYGKAIERTYDAGQAVANMAAYGLLNKAAPPFVMAPAMEVTKDNLVDAYHIAWHKDPPPEVLQALGQ